MEFREGPGLSFFVHKTKIEIYAMDSQGEEVISKVLMYCLIGKMGEVKIAAILMDGCARVYTGERIRRY